MKRPLHRSTHVRHGTSATVVAGTVALALALAGCGDPSSDSAEQPAALPDGLVAVAGYNYVDTTGDPVGDPTVAAVVDAYESWEVRPPEIVVSEDFESGAGPFWQGSDELGSITLADGALRITSTDEEFGMESYADLNAPADSLLVLTDVTIAEPLQEEEGPALSASRWDGEDLVLSYEFWIDGRTAYLVKWAGLEEVRLLDSVSIAAPLQGEVSMGLWVFARGEDRFVVGFLDGEPIVDSDSASGSLNSVGLAAYSAGSPRTVDFEWVDIYAVDEGEALPKLFADQSELAVEQDGRQVATIAVLEPSDYLADVPQFDTDQCCSVLEGTAPPGMTVSTVTAAGEPIVEGELDGTSFWVWTSEDHWTVVSAADQAEGKAFVEAYIAAETTSET